ncbi:hypothetical protein WJX73_007262 [Symbiochloris irregularis]|uniref:Condensin complex subunit 1 n=1 Tax=Symbiochloris irregularis TaxID=706552 RepID=A0AAW1PF40_9CHLO
MAVTKAQEQQQALLRALHSSDWEAFFQFIDNLESTKTETLSLTELVQSLSQKDRHSLCAGLENQADVAIHILTATRESLEDGQASEEQEDQMELACRSLHAVAHAAAQVLACHPKAPPEPLIAAAEKLHDNALLAATEAPELQGAVAQLCLSWWQAGAPGKQRLVPQTLPYLLVKALTSGQTADVKRCHAIKEAFQLLDYDDESIADVRSLLIRAVFSPAFLRAAEGRRFLGFLFTLQGQLVAQLGLVIRNQIPALRGSILDAYGEILHKGWREAAGACQLALESLVQELAQASILASTPTIAAALRRILNGFHKNKASAAVDSMLLRLYQPILFRGFSAANASVRLNALALLVDAFPLQDPSAPNDETNELLAKQFTILGTCLSDAAPAVRAEGVKGLCRLLDLYWEMIPAATSASFLKRLTGELLHDASSTAVRCTVLQGLSLLCHNPLTHALLKALLPTVGTALQDPVLKVRIAFADLLLAVGATSGLHFLELVTLDALVTALAEDSPQVTSRLQSLLQPSYYPGPDAGPALVAALLRQHPSAGATFCAALSGGLGNASDPRIPMEQLLSLVGDLRDHLLACMPCGSGQAQGSAPQKPKRRGTKRKGKQQPATTPGAEERAETPEAWEAILGGLAQLCRGLALAAASGQDIPDTSPLFKPSALTDLMRACLSPVARCHVLEMATHLPAEAGADAVREWCFDTLLDDSQQDEELAAKLRCIVASPAPTDEACSSGQRLIGSLASALAPDFEGTQTRMAVRAGDLMLADAAVHQALPMASLEQTWLPALQAAATSCCQSLSLALAAGTEGSVSEHDAALTADASGPLLLSLCKIGDRACQVAADLCRSSLLGHMSPPAGSELNSNELQGGILSAVSGVLALAADAAVLLQWKAGSSADHAACELAAAYLQHIGASGDAMVQASAVCITARLLAATEPGSRADLQAHQLGEAILSAALCLDDVPKAFGPALGACLARLCSACPPGTSARWLHPVAKAWPIDMPRQESAASSTQASSGRIGAKENIALNTSQAELPGKNPLPRKQAKRSADQLQRDDSAAESDSAQRPPEAHALIALFSKAAAAAKVQGHVRHMALHEAWQSWQAGHVALSVGCACLASTMPLTGGHKSTGWEDIASAARSQLLQAVGEVGGDEIAVGEAEAKIPRADLQALLSAVHVSS